MRFLVPRNDKVLFILNYWPVSSPAQINEINLRRRDFLYITGLGASATLLPSLNSFGRAITVEEALTPIDVKFKKQMADVALNAAKSNGATYADVRIGRYLNQVVSTRDTRVENVANGESYGLGVRVLAGGSWGFAATNNLDNDSIAKAAEMAVAMRALPAK